MIDYVVTTAVTMQVKLPETIDQTRFEKQVSMGDSLSDSGISRDLEILDLEVEADPNKFDTNILEFLKDVISKANEEAEIANVIDEILFYVEQK